MWWGYACCAEKHPEIVACLVTSRQPSLEVLHCVPLDGWLGGEFVVLPEYAREWSQNDANPTNNLFLVSNSTIFIDRKTEVLLLSLEASRSHRARQGGGRLQHSYFHCVVLSTCARARLPWCSRAWRGGVGSIYWYLHYCISQCVNVYRHITFIYQHFQPTLIGRHNWWWCLGSVVHTSS